MKEKTFFHHYSVLEIERNGLYEYYLSKQGYGNLYFMYGVEKENFPTPVEVLKNIQIANRCGFWE